MTPIETAALKASAESAKGFLNKIFGPALDEVGLILQDNIKIRRLKNQIRNLDKVKKIVEEEDISMQQVNLKVLVPYLENVSLEENETLQDLWANLIVNYIDEFQNLNTSVFPSILSQISTEEYKILVHMQSHNLGLNLSWEGKDREKTWDVFSVANLVRLGLIEEEQTYKTERISNWYDDGGSINVTNEGSMKYRMTSFGESFLYACTR